MLLFPNDQSWNNNLRGRTRMGNRRLSSYLVFRRREPGIRRFSTAKYGLGSERL